ncbi:helix-turn-helix transcriptional regulator [Chryseobacterium endophyticum]|uniref:Helix-turn-helix transcriptional regulator n=1 Tax=Chryseobacterium endophyticum TaxID=1854762 RepID=A0AAU6WPN2_9FLAO|nr:helix-turn-helix transcriptional regulator [uncultured Chryseobacterium sp.]
MGIGTNLKKLRTKTRFSQQEIADMLGLDRNTYTRWENESTDIKSQYIPKLAEIFHVSIPELFDDGKRSEFIITNYSNQENEPGIIRQSIIINITDPEAAKIISSQLEELVKNLKK